MPANPSPLQSLRLELASSPTSPSEVASRFAAKANANASSNTYLTPYSTESLRRAEQLPHLFPDPKTRPALYGIPISIKDCFDVAGSITTCASRFYAQHNPPAQKNSWVAQRLLDQGAILTGKTHLHQLASGITGENADYGDCLQPRDPTLLTGGSSSGAAASVQEGSALAAIGTDTGGSVRVPSALCGLAGYRSSVGVSRGETFWAGGYHLAPTFDTLGILFRDLRDAPALANSIFGIALLPPPASAMHIGFAGDDFVHDCEPEVLAAYNAWKQHLAAHGATLSSFDTAFWSASLDIFAPIQASEAAAIHAAATGGDYSCFPAPPGCENLSHFPKAISERLAWGASLTVEEVQRQRQRHAEFRNRVDALFQSFDFLIMPCSPISKLEAGRDHTQTRPRVLRYTTPLSLVGSPVVTLPFPNGAGIQLSAPRGQDSRLLTYAAALAT